MKIALSNDHGGTELKVFISDYLKKLNYEIINLGTNTTVSVDYPDYAYSIARLFKEESIDFGILVCGSGIGISIAANRYSHIRAALCNDVKSCELSRLHNDANILVLLSDVDGLYTSDPNLNLEASHIQIVEKITDDIEMMATDKESGFSKGGMRTKLEAAKVAVAAGCHMVITNGDCRLPIHSISQGRKSTWFVSSDDPIDARKQWIFNTKAKGEIYVDTGAEKAIVKGKSLLPAGVIKITGEFYRGDTVVILSSDGKFLARGLIGYSYKVYYASVFYQIGVCFR